MAKINQGRLDGVWRMRRFSASELNAIADEYEAQILDPGNLDDPPWLQSRADRLRELALKNELAIEHKSNN